jgi:hypothetical protein
MYGGDPMQDNKNIAARWFKEFWGNPWNPRIVNDLNFWGVGNFIADGDLVVGRWEGGGTHTGQAFSNFRMGSIPAASGRKMKFAGTTVLRLENGRIAEELGQEDALSAMLQLGLICLPELELAQARPGGPLPRGWNNMSGSSETGR